MSDRDDWKKVIEAWIDVVADLHDENARLQAEIEQLKKIIDADTDAMIDAVKRGEGTHG